MASRGYQWLNGAGLHSHDVADAADFRISTFEKPQRWATGAMYQIFPVRFAKSIDRPARIGPGQPPGMTRWIGEGPDRPRQYYGGDLDGHDLIFFFFAHFPFRGDELWVITSDTVLCFSTAGI
jgi:hypothetical protein